MNVLLADSGSTKSEWCLLSRGRKKIVYTQGLSPYFISAAEMAAILSRELVPKLGGARIDEVHYYGTGCVTAKSRAVVRKALRSAFPAADLSVDHDLTAAAHALCGKDPGIACILGTGSNSGYYNGKKILRNSPGLGYALGDEGSGSYLGRKVLQYYLYGTFDAEMRHKFDEKFHTTPSEILDNVYRKPFPNRYIASFTKFLAENRHHYMVENIIEDGLNDFFFVHLCKFPEVWKQPVHFVGSVAFGFKDVLQELCDGYKWQLGKVLKKPMEGLIAYHR